MIIQLFSGPMIDRVPLRGLLVYTQLSLGPAAAHCACGELFRLFDGRFSACHYADTNDTEHVVLSGSNVGASQNP
ncbi:hypothetical protein [Paenibacillus lautus]|uniref:hypothetical protein n=1 Tax=Paenibacillus lautus TaxID=1401 RepID=UPI003D9A9460